MKADLNAAQRTIYTFEGFRLDARKRLLFGPEGDQIPLVPKAFDILLYLVTNADRLTEKDELMNAIWPETAVEENNLTQNVSAIRKALGEQHKENRFIATVPGHGYRFVAEVYSEPDHHVTSSAPPATAGEIRPKVRNAWILKFVAVAVVVFAAGIGITFFLRSTLRKAAAEPIRSIAVLPFKPIAANIRNESLEMGMADTLIHRLSGVENLKIRPLTAVRRFADPDQDAVAAGRELGVDAVLDGRLQIENERIRATVQFVSVTTGEPIWSGQFDEKLTDIFSLQDSIAQRVATQLRISLGEKSSKRYTESVEAYQAYMLGNLHTRRLIKAEVEKGLAYYEKAIGADPQFALAYVEIANANRALVLTSDAPPAQLMPKARDAALKAVQLDPELSEAWSSLAISNFWYEWDWRAAEENHKKALDLNADSAPSRALYAHFLSNMGRHSEAVHEIRRARETDPANLLTNALEGQILFFAGDNAAAEQILKRTADLDLNFWLAHLFLTRVYLQDGRFDDAVATARRAAELSGGNAEATATTAYALALAGRSDEARVILDELLERSRQRYVPRYAIAQVYVALGEGDKALEELSAAFQSREPLMTFLKVERKWDPIRNDPRFQTLLSRIKLNS